MSYKSKPYWNVAIWCHLFLLKNIFTCICLSLCVWEDGLCGRQFSSTTTWVLRLYLRSPGLEASPFLHSHLSSPFCRHLSLLLLFTLPPLLHFYNAKKFSFSNFSSKQMLFLLWLSFVWHRFLLMEPRWPLICEPPASASQVLEIHGASCHWWLINSFVFLILCGHKKHSHVRQGLCQWAILPYALVLIKIAYWVYVKVWEHRRHMIHM